MATFIEKIVNYFQASDSVEANIIEADIIEAVTLKGDGSNITNLTMNKATKAAYGVIRFANETELVKKADNLAVTALQMSDAINQGMPIGSIIMWAGESIPAGWALFDKSTLPTLSGAMNDVVIMYLIRESDRVEGDESGGQMI